MEIRSNKVAGARCRRKKEYVRLPLCCSHPGICKLLSFDEVPLRDYIVPHEWVRHASDVLLNQTFQASHQGDCPGCNQFSVKNLMRYLNPHEWFNGVTSATEVAALALEVHFLFRVH